MKEEAVVLYPSPAIGHLISMVELGKLILTHHPSLSIHVLLTSQAYNAGPTSSYIASVSAAVPSLVFHHLPTIALPADFSTSSPHHETLAFALLRLNNPNLHATLSVLSETHVIHALIIDFFCAVAVSVAREFVIPCYYFFTSCAGFLTFFLYLPTLHGKIPGSFKDLKNEKTNLLQVPGIPPISPSDAAKPLIDREDDAYKGFLDSALKMRASAGIIVNTFEKLEPRAIKAILDGECVPSGPTPPLYCIGPLISRGEGRREGGGGESGPPELFAWLDSQPSRSVVFLCFGSLGVFSRKQLMEIAAGLERSGQRFLWVLKSPPPDKDTTVATSGLPEPDLDALLPEGFLGRTKERGLVVKSWAPQVSVLSHGSVGGFVTHCGWNSVLEAVCAGVPMIAWPLYAEQRHNRVLLVKDMGIALPMEESPEEEGLVSWEEVEKRVRELMESKEGKIIRERAASLGEEAKAALRPTGSSRLALAQLVESWVRN